MTLLTIVDIRDRVMALCETIVLPPTVPDEDPPAPAITGLAYRDEEECSWKTSDLPAYVVEESGRGSEYVYNYGSDPCAYLTRDQIRIILYLSHICDESYTKDFDSIDYSNRCKAAVVLFFAGKPKLQMPWPPFVESARITRSTSPHTGATKGATTKNRIIVFNMTVEYVNYA